MRNMLEDFLISASKYLYAEYKPGVLFKLIKNYDKEIVKITTQLIAHETVIYETTFMHHPSKGVSIDLIQLWYTDLQDIVKHY